MADSKVDGTKPDSTGPNMVSAYPVSFPVMRFGNMRMTLDGKKEIPNDVSRYVKHIENSSGLSEEEIMYLVKRVADLEDEIGRIVKSLRMYE
jgi:hypothetical protein